MNPIVCVGSEEKGDVLVTLGLQEESQTHQIQIHSPVRSLFKKQQDQVIAEMVAHYQGSPLFIEISDNHALDWVLRARLLTAFQMLEHWNG